MKKEFYFDITSFDVKYLSQTTNFLGAKFLISLGPNFISSPPLVVRCSLLDDPTFRR